MTKKLYVGNLPFTTTTGQLRDLFAEHGEVSDAVVIEDRETGRSRGFGFVEMGSEEDAQKAIAAMNGKSIDGRQLNVNIARERSR
jgi:RNA recognition motif-containing protein